MTGSRENVAGSSPHEPRRGFERFCGTEQDAAGVWTPPGSNQKVACFKDPDGNLLWLTQTG